MKEQTKTLVMLIAFVGIVFGFILYLAANAKVTLNVLMLTTGWMLCLLVGLAGLTILWQIWIGKIDMSSLFSEQRGGAASFSRFQFFIFTFVIAMSLFLVIVGGGTPMAEGSQPVPKFPTSIPNEILMLLGISAGSYLVSKGMPDKKEGEKPDGGADPAAEAANAKGKIATLMFHVDNQLKSLGDESTDGATEKQLRATLTQLKDAAKES